MSVNSWRELPRVTRHLIGESPELERRFVVTLNNPDTTSSLMIAAVGATHGSAHPEVPSATCYDLEVNEAYEENRYWAEVVARYRIPDEQQPSQLPWLRPDVWKFESLGAAVPALFYLDGDEKKPLTNSAGDYFEGLTVDEAQQRVVVTGNRQAFPSATAAAITNCINDATYLGWPANCIKVSGISAESAVEVIQGQEYKYWKITFTLLARQTGWDLFLPDVGFNYIQSGERKRAYVIGPDGEELASSNPVPLNGSGGLKAGGEFPSVLTRQIYKQITMSSYFGTPPT